VHKLELTTNSQLNHLVEACRAGYFAFAEAARCAKAPELQVYFKQVSQERLSFGQALFLELFQSNGELGGGQPGNLECPLPWQVVQHRLRGQDDLYLLRELAQLEDFTLKLYQTARRQAWPEELRTLLEAQSASITRVHQQLRAECADALQKLSLTAVSHKTAKRRSRPTLLPPAQLSP